MGVVAYLKRFFQEFLFHSKINFIAPIFLHIKVEIMNNFKQTTQGVSDP